MSLDVYLKIKRPEIPEAGKAAALLRQHSYAEFADELEARHDVSEYECVFTSTHNLNVPITI